VLGQIGQSHCCLGAARRGRSWATKPAAPLTRSPMSSPSIRPEPWRRADLVSPIYVSCAIRITRTTSCSRSLRRPSYPASIDSTPGEGVTALIGVRAVQVGSPALLPQNALGVSSSADMTTSAPSSPPPRTPGAPLLSGAHRMAAEFARSLTVGGAKTDRRANAVRQQQDDAQGADVDGRRGPQRIEACFDQALSAVTRSHEIFL
jgi:hypothetical protein